MIGPEQRPDQQPQNSLPIDPISGIPLPIFPKPLVVLVDVDSARQILNELSVSIGTLVSQGGQEREQVLLETNLPELAEGGISSRDYPNTRTKLSSTLTEEGEPMGDEELPLLWSGDVFVFRISPSSEQHLNKSDPDTATEHGTKN